MRACWWLSLLLFGPGEAVRKREFLPDGVQRREGADPLSGSFADVVEGAERSQPTKRATTQAPSPTTSTRVVATTVPKPAKQPGAAASTNSEILQGAVNRLWAIDAPYRLEPGTDFKLNVQNRAASVSSGADRSTDVLFTYVNEDKLMKAPCIRSFIALLDNYERDLSQGEIETDSERAERGTFLTELTQTAHMRFAYDALVAKDSFSGDYAAFGKKVEQIWFTQFSVAKGGLTASSGFEHVFVGEEKHNQISGFHNWIQFWKEEKAGHLNYLGYVDTPPKLNAHMLLARFAWQDKDAAVEVKSVSSVLVGSSVPFEMAMLTYTFLAFGGSGKIPGIFFDQDGPTDVTIYDWNTKSGKVIRTGYIGA